MPNGFSVGCCSPQREIMGFVEMNLIRRPTIGSRTSEGRLGFVRRKAGHDIYLRTRVRPIKQASHTTGEAFWGESRVTNGREYNGNKNSMNKT